MSSMKAVRIHAYGSADVLAYEDAPRPTARDGEVLIRVHATSVNPFDCAVRAGYMSAYFTYTLPVILGTDVSGVIEEVGTGVTTFKRGDSVYARGGVTRDGAYAQYVAVPASDVAAKPKSLDHLHSAAIPHAILTAWQALFGLANLDQGPNRSDPWGGRRGRSSGGATRQVARRKGHRHRVAQSRFRARARRR